MSPGSIHDPQKPATTDGERVASVFFGLSASLVGALMVLLGIVGAVGGSRTALAHHGNLELGDLGGLAFCLGLTLAGGLACAIGARLIARR